MTLLSELKRRRVFRVAAVYGAAAWIITEVSATVFPALGIPDWTVTFLIVLLIFGFPIAMVFAWIYDIGPQGVQRTEPVEKAEQAVRSRRGLLVYGGLLALAMLALVILLDPLGWRDAWDTDRPRSIAVLPFANLSDDPARDYFSDGMSEELLNLLSKVPGLRVAARTSSFAFKDKQVDIRKVAQQLGVETVLEGSVRWSEDQAQVRITAQLIDAKDGYHLWSETYNAKLENIFEVQDRIADQIVKALRIELSSDGDGKSFARVELPTSDIKAYEDYLQGRHYWKRRGEGPLRRSIDYFRSALGRDPGFARASAALAAAYVVMPVYAEEPEEVFLPMAEAAAMQALALDENLAEAHAVLAQIHSDRWNWTDAESGFFFAVSLDPNEATSRQWYSGHLRNMGRLGRALAEAEKAHELDPTSPVITAHLADTYMILGENGKASDFAQQAEELGLARDLGALKGLIRMREGDLEGALQLFGHSEELEKVPTEDIEAWLMATRDPAAAQQVAEALHAAPAGAIPADQLILLYATLGHADFFFEVSRDLADKKKLPLTWLWGPEVAAMRRDGRFATLVEQAGLIDYWKQYGSPDQCRLTAESLSCAD